MFTRGLRREAPIVRDVALLHGVGERLHVAGAELHVVRGRGRAVGGQRDGGGRRAGGRRDTKRGLLELQERLDVERLARIVLEGLVDDALDLVLRKGLELAAVSDRLAPFRHGQAALRDGEVGLGNRVALIQAAALT